MICWYELDVPIGSKHTGMVDYSGIRHDQPVVVIRRAAKEEFINAHREATGRIGDLALLEGLYFYEIHTD